MATQKRRKPVRMPGAATPLVNPKTGVLNQQLQSTLNNLAAGTQDQFQDTIYTWTKSCLGATTTNIPATYDNGVNGVGATLTITGTSIEIDSITWDSSHINSRILFKNQNNSYENGIYVLSGVINNQIIFTRSIDYCNYSQTPQINIGDVVEVIGGLVNGFSAWVQTSFNSGLIPGSYISQLGLDVIAFVTFVPYRVESGIGNPNNPTVGFYPAIDGRFYVRVVDTITREYKALYMYFEDTQEWIEVSHPTGIAGGDLSGEYPNPTVSSISFQIDLTSQVTDVLPEANGGTGESTYTDGELLIGNTAGGLTKATLTAGSNITITNGDGSITIDATGGGGSGDVTGPGSSTNNAIVLWDGVGGDTIKDSAVTFPIPVGSGGTGLTSYTQGDLLYYNSGTTLSKLAKSNSTAAYLTNQGSSNNPAWGQIDLENGVFGYLHQNNGGLGPATGPFDDGMLLIGGTSDGTLLGSYLTAGTNIGIVRGSHAITINLSGTVAVANGGTGETTYTDGQLLIGNSSDSGLTKATLTAGTGISITNGNGSITIANTASSGDWVKIGSTTASNSTAITFTGLSSTYAAYKLVMSHVKPVTDAVYLWLRTSTNNGSSYDSGGTNYIYGNAFVSSTAVASQTGSTGAAQLVVGGQLGNEAGEQYNAEVMLYQPSAADFGSLSWNTWAINSAGAFNAVFGGGYRNTAADVDAIQILMSSGNISSGVFTLYGLKA